MPIKTVMKIVLVQLSLMIAMYAQVVYQSMRPMQTKIVMGIVLERQL